jgi:hypothetical protein
VEQIEYFYENSVFAKRLLPHLENFDRTITWEQALQAALVVTLAAQEHYRMHGRFPESLDELGALLGSQPLDPFATTDQPLVYRRTDTGAVIYSIGDDGADNGAQFATPGAPLQGNKLDIGYEIRTPKDTD